MLSFGMKHRKKWRQQQNQWGGGTTLEAADSDNDTDRTSDVRQYVTHVKYPKGILDEDLWEHCDTIAQQTNCIGCRGAGLARGLAKALPYGCSYATKRPILPGKQFAVPRDRTTPGTIHVRHPWSKRTTAPTVINMFAQ